MPVQSAGKVSPDQEMRELRNEKTPQMHQNMTIKKSRSNRCFHPVRAARAVIPTVQPIKTTVHTPYTSDTDTRPARAGTVIRHAPAQGSRPGLPPASPLGPGDSYPNPVYREIPAPGAVKKPHQGLPSPHKSVRYAPRRTHSAGEPSQNIATGG